MLFTCKLPQNLRLTFWIFNMTFQNYICFYTNVFADIHNWCALCASVTALVAIIHFFYTQIWNHPEILQSFLRKSVSLKWRASSWNLFLIQLFTITVSKILVLLKVSAKTDRFQRAQDFTSSFSEFSWFSWGTSNCQFKPNTMECLWNTKEMWILKISWQSRTRYKEKLKLGLISGTVLACLSGQTAHTELRTRYSMRCLLQSPGYGTNPCGIGLPLAKEPGILAVRAWITCIQCPSGFSGSRYWAVKQTCPSLIS